MTKPTDTLENMSTFILQDSDIQYFIKQYPSIEKRLAEQSLPHQKLLFSFIACGGGDNLVEGLSKSSHPEKDFSDFLAILEEIEAFYAPLGGIVGYYQEMRHLMQMEKKIKKAEIKEPAGVSLKEAYDTHIFHGLELLPKLAIFFPVGGAGDRLALKDEKTGESLPAACLKFSGKTLLEGLFLDLQALEYLYEKLFKKKITLPIVLMTSMEKDNHRQIVQILEENRWFNRPKESVHFIVQPLAPVLTADGKWVFSSPLKLLLKPGGHGVLWKLASDAGVLSTLHKQGIRKGLVRQINNPLASLDGGLLAFIGVGKEGNKEFGFASCERLLHASEGMVVLKKEEDEWCLTNIEYTDFCHYGIKDCPKHLKSPYSRFPSNTNILFCDLEAIERLVEKNPFPGKIVNMKSKAMISGKEIVIGRLETTMQNIADCLTASDPRALSSFVTFGERQKTISVTKRGYEVGKPMEETPVGAFYDWIVNMHALVEKDCKVDLPSLSSPGEYLEKGPSFIFLFHPALGPLWSIIGQKWRGGSVCQGGEVQVELADFNCEALNLEGSCLVRASHPLQAKCTLKNVTIQNLGIDREKTTDYWRNDYARREAFEVYLEGRGEFYAEEVTFKGSVFVTVPDQHKMIAKQEGTKVVFHLEKLEAPTWDWEYQWGNGCKVTVSKKR